MGDQQPFEGLGSLHLVLESFLQVRWCYPLRDEEAAPRGSDGTCWGVRSCQMWTLNTSHLFTWVFNVHVAPGTALDAEGRTVHQQPVPVQLRFL